MISIKLPADTKKAKTISITKDQKPIKISWIIVKNSIVIKDKDESLSSTYFSINEKSNSDKNSYLFGISQCPGKQLIKGRDGKPHLRSIENDIKYFRDQDKIDIIVCLINDYELRGIGVNADTYRKQCAINNIEFIYYPIIEMACPDDRPADFDAKLIEVITKNLEKGKRVIAHCRGGIGRAGMLACCVVLKLGLMKSAKETVNLIRSMRDSRCVESKKQMDYIIEFLKYLQNSK